MQLRLGLAFVLASVGCGGEGTAPEIDPTDIAFGDTAVVVVVNPTVDEENQEPVPTPGTRRGNILVSTDDGVSDTTGADGIAVLAPLTAGARTITLAGDEIDASFTLILSDGALREVAVAVSGTDAEIMVDLDYKTDEVLEVVPSMTNEEVNDALGVSDRVVFIRGGTYAGDLDFSGSRVTLFGEGVLGGSVILDGNITMSGSDSRLRGALVTGSMTIPASGTGVSFSQIEGPIASEGSDATLLSNALCDTVDITGSGALVVGNDVPCS